MVVSFAVSESLLLVVARAEKGLLAFGANKVLHVPLFAECVDDAIFDRTPARTTNRDAHLIVTTKTIQIAIFFAGFRI